jgi:putative lipoprotein
MRRARWLSFLIALPAVALTRIASAEQSDPWWGKDKALHFGISAGLAAGGYAASTAFVEPRWQRAAIGSGFALSLGAGKELYDLSGHGDPSWKDFAWDVAGTAVGIAIALAVDLAFDRKDNDKAPATALVRF